MYHTTATSTKEQQPLSLSSSFIIIVHRATNTILLVSDEASQLLGYTSPDQLIGKPANDLKYHDILLQIHHDPIEPLDYWCLEFKQGEKRQSHEQKISIIKLSQYGIIQHVYPTIDMPKMSYSHEQQRPIMRHVHPDDVEMLCRHLSQLYKHRQQHEDNIYTQHKPHYEQTTVSIRYHYDEKEDQDDVYYQPVLLTVTLLNDRSIVFIRPRDFSCYYYGHSLLRYVVAYIIHVLLYTVFFFISPSSSDRKKQENKKIVKVNNEMIVVHSKNDDALEDLVRIRCMTAFYDFRSYTDSNAGIQNCLKWMERIGLVKNGLLDNAQITMERVLDQIFT